MTSRCAAICSFGAEPDEKCGRAFVVQLTLSGCEVGIDGRLHQRVDEAERRLGAQDLRAHEFARRGSERRCVELSELGRDGDLRTLTEHRDRQRDPLGLLREPGEAGQHRSRGRPWPQLGDNVDMGSVGRHMIRGECLQELVEQKRVAVGRGVAGFGESGLHVLAQAVSHELCGGHHRERPRHEHLRMRLAGQLFQDRLISLGLRRPQARDEHDGEVLKPPRQVGEKPQRGAVAPMKVVHHQQQRALGAEVDGQPVEPVQHRERALAKRPASLQLVGVPEHRRRRPRCARQQP